MSFLTLEFAILFLKVLNIDFPLKTDFSKCRREIAASLNDFIFVIVATNGKMLNLMS